jgi:hypothetical protein
MAEQTTICVPLSIKTRQCKGLNRPAERSQIDNYDKAKQDQDASWQETGHHTGLSLSQTSVRPPRQGNVVWRRGGLGPLA